MRFGIEAGAWRNPRGYGRFLRGLSSALARRGRHEWILALDEVTESAGAASGSLPRVVIATGHAASAGASSEHHRSLAEMFRMSRGLSRCRFDAILFPSPLTYVPARGTPEFLVLHDVTAERHPELVFESSAAARRWRWKTKIGLRRARRVLTVSEHSRRGIAEVYGIEPERIRVIPEAADPIFFEPARPGPKRPRPYLLFVGGLSPHKNISVVVEALKRVPEVDLLLAGPFETDVFHAQDVAALVAASGLAARVESVSDPDDAALRDLYAGALALVLPSLDEGFGLPAVEAAAAGTPSILSDSTGAAERLGGSALLFDPRDSQQLVAHVRSLVENPGRRASLGAQAQRSAALLDWD
ncbi:MAG: glycosyltransferase family 4 protein, partial [Acidobacteriota bacterium]|nr:glycosyltransferase family 4 protein [Acidobacteriota bacterium]